MASMGCVWTTENLDSMWFLAGAFSCGSWVRAVLWQLTGNEAHEIAAMPVARGVNRKVAFVADVLANEQPAIDRDGAGVTQRR